jgi:large subunit ribosomal protein L4
MLSNVVIKLRISFPVFRTLSSSTNVEPRQLPFPPKYQKPRQVWLENFDTIEEKKLGIIELHPEVFAVNPRIDLIHDNVRWQFLYRFVSYAHTKSRFEVRGGGRKPWPQKGVYY